MPGIVAPERFPIRDPRDVKMNLGRLANPPRMIEIGGFDEQKKWDRGTIPTSDQMGSNVNAFPVEGGGPTGVKSTHDSTGTDDD